MGKERNTKFRVENKTAFLKTVNPSHPTLDGKIGLACADSADKLLKKIKKKRNNEGYKSSFSISSDNINRNIERVKEEKVEFTITVLNTFLCFFFSKKSPKYEYTEIHTEQNLRDFFNHITIRNGKKEALKKFNQFMRDLELIKEDLTPLFSTFLIEINEEFEFLISEKNKPGDINSEGSLNIDKEIPLNKEKTVEIVVSNATVKANNIQITHETPKKNPKKLTIVPAINPNNFVGRELELEEIHNSLLQYQFPVLVRGMGGVGKSTLMAFYCQKYIDLYKHIIFISCNQDFLSSDLVKQSRLLQYLNISVDKNVEQNIIQDFFFKLNEFQEGINLLVIDNVTEDLSSYIDLFSSQCNWHIVVTSRKQFGSFEKIELDVPKTRDAIQLFKKYCTRIEDEKEITSILEHIEFHTLTTEILAKTIQRQRLSLSDIEHFISKDQKTGITTKHSQHKKIGNILSYLSSIFDLSKLNKVENMLLKMFSYFPEGFHSFEIIEELIKELFKSLDNASNEAHENLREFFSGALESLVDKGWLICDEQHNSYSLHQVLKLVLLEKNKSNKGALHIRLLSFLFTVLSNDLLEGKFYSEEVKKWFTYYETLIKLYVNHKIPFQGNPSDVFMSSYLIIQFYIASGNFSKVKFETNKLLKSDFAKNVSEDYIYYLNLLKPFEDKNNSISSYKNDFTKLIEAMEVDINEDHFYTLYMLILNTNIKQSEFMVSRIESIFDRHPNSKKKFKGHIDFIIANLYIKKSNQRKALDYFKKAYIFFGDSEDPMFYMSIISNLSDIENKLKNYTESLSYCEKGLKLFSKTLDEHHLINLKLRITKISNLINLGFIEKALEYINNSLIILEGHNHSLTPVFYDLKGIAYSKSQKITEAIKEYYHAINLQLIYNPDEVSDTLIYYTNLAKAYESNNESEKVITTYEKGLETIKQDSILIEDYLNTFTSYLFKYKKYQKASEILQRLQTIRENYYGEGSRNYAATLYHMGYSFYKQKEYSKTYVFCLKAIAIYETNSTQQNQKDILNVFALLVNSYKREIKEVSKYYNTLWQTKSQEKGKEKILQLEKKLVETREKKIALMKKVDGEFSQKIISDLIPLITNLINLKQYDSAEKNILEWKFINEKTYTNHCFQTIRVELVHLRLYRKQNKKQEIEKKLKMIEIILKEIDTNLSSKEKKFIKSYTSFEYGNIFFEEQNYKRAFQNYFESSKIEDKHKFKNLLDSVTCNFNASKALMNFSTDIGKLNKNKLTIYILARRALDIYLIENIFNPLLRDEIEAYLENIYVHYPELRKTRAIWKY